MYQTTIEKPVELVGIGLHKGSPVKLRLEPLEDNSGIIFYRSDVDVAIPLFYVMGMEIGMTPCSQRMRL